MKCEWYPPCDWTATEQAENRRWYCDIHTAEVAWQFEELRRMDAAREARDEAAEREFLKPIR